MWMVGLGSNNAFMPIGLFETRQAAEDALLEAGCVRKGRGIAITTAFQGWMEAHKLSFYSIYSLHEPGNTFLFREAPIDSISMGYDDD